jgi:hypothetical protein
MGTRLLVQDGTYPILWCLGGAPAFVRREWQSLGTEAIPEAINDNDPDSRAKEKGGSVSALGAGAE